MNIDPTYTSIGTLFENNRSSYYIPIYQRGYAWKVDNLNDFKKDMNVCFQARKNGQEVNHFFGGILSVERSVTGAVNQHKYEIIDGQQRIATINLFVACLMNAYGMLKEEANRLGDTTNEGIIERRIDRLTVRFFEFDLEINRVTEVMKVLALSRSDDAFFHDLIRGQNPQPNRETHRNIISAYQMLQEVVDAAMRQQATIEGKIDDLEHFQNVIDNDFTVLHMVTTSRDDAFRLFQVINDRGVSLTDGDLLRAKTLELLEGHDRDQCAVEQKWDEILSDDPKITGCYLSWIYESRVGGRPKKNAFFDMFLDEFFPEHQAPQITNTESESIKSKVIEVYDDILKCKKLERGEWLYANQLPITGWDRNRLQLLLVELGHDLSMPLLLASNDLDHRKFSSIVQMTEKVFFRYKKICKLHEAPLKKIYYEEINEIRRDPGAYNEDTLRNKLQALVEAKANDNIFRNSLETLEYTASGGSNKSLKYFLMTVEYYYQWFLNGAIGSPQCLDKSRLYDFSGTSIEHVYPRNAAQGNMVQALEHLKNSIGNLTIMDPVQNSGGGNDMFEVKKELYRDSSVKLTQEIGNKAVWDINEIQRHKNNLINVALRVFVP